MNPLTIAIPTYNNPQQLEWCLASLFNYTQFPFHVIVVDNGGKGEVKKILGDNPFGVEVLEPENNGGWMQSINLALRQAESKFFCMMNDDVCFLPDSPAFWRFLISHFEDAHVGAVGPASNYVAGPQSLMQVDTGLIFDSTILIGFCLLTKTALLQNLGGLDESLPGGDDLDLSIRVRNQDLLLRVDKRSYLHHFGQQTGTRVHGKHWDSSWHQEVTRNALIHKHGLKSWFDCFSCKFAPLLPIKPNETENAWIKARLEVGLDILDIGAGNRKLEGVKSVDKIDGFGVAGGQKGLQSQPDIIADALNIPLPDESQDVIIATHILEHMLDPLRALQEWKRLLRLDGLLLLSVPDNDKLATMVIDHTHLHAYNKDSLAHLLVTADFTVHDSIVDPHGGLRVEAGRASR